MTDLTTNPITDPGVDDKITVQLYIDHDLLDEARRQTGMSTNAVINFAVRTVIGQERERRLRAYDEVQQMAAEGLLDFDAIDRADR